MSEETEKLKVKALVVTDGIFEKQCDDPIAYIAKLKDNINKNAFKFVELVSFEGSHGICGVDSTIASLDLDTKNKTAFIQSLENNSALFDELIIIRIAEDTFVNGAKQSVTEMNKPIYTFGYNRKG